MNLLSKGLKITFFIIVIIFMVIGFVASWRDTLTENAIKQAVTQGIYNGFQELYQGAPRLKMTDPNSTYYVPDIQHLKSQTFTVYKETLEYVNEDMSTPICKITSVRVVGYGNMQVSATVKFRGFLGVVRTVQIQEEVDSPHFKYPTGSEHY